MSAQVKLSTKLKWIKQEDFEEEEELEDEEEEEDEEDEQHEEQQISFTKGLIMLLVLIGILIGLAPTHSEYPVQAFTTSQESTYIVQKGDSLWSIAKNKFPGKNANQKMQEIRDLNHLNGDQIRLGQKLQMP